MDGLVKAAYTYSRAAMELQLDRFNVTNRAQNPAEEDAYCANMRKLGATWFESEEAYMLLALQHSRPQKQVL
ncbi:hypothetical protein IFM58399_02009 [Aspergillus lentulus]|uniref:Uncharacterized protein n=1 Tax=Aspergillus lentulus TaxID=293939 RepID=A0AAN5YWC7_ASPLE|nr:uncharacterized protein IFM58399_02009 [Aspergillus lentulus]KAF4161125.1 hypothetical protein CNMCM6069_006088 [Aspergillus lentulus]KAF4169054.1 hypothetical protein CNMCM6936_009651 [Aspergillus lentulus]KAF4182115.1 hypothetical protein CNMCM8060_007479 [Aspergillus lentulus]KAF4190169.1 hypothetical protein CNMCM7927_004899 [Aspergillus lentulus]KAF4199180.1 hypothetical protein CNMCM8694_006026 [Aspergillus lentulus]